MAYKDPAEGRARDRERFRRRNADRVAQGLCPNCGKAPPAPGRTSCRRCAGKRRAAERARYARAKAAGKLYGERDPEERRRNARGRTKRCYDARREAGLCGRCGEATFDGASRCGRCAALEAGRHRQKNAASRKRYARRRARGECTDCGAPSQGAARCESCARRSCERSGHFRGIPTWPIRYTVIELATGEDHGTYDSEAEVAACLAFARLSFDQVEVLGGVSPMQRFTAWS